ncbi:hypothetical protein HELRODRAFT_180225 [Helobdella robusta]|uniref:Major facilitator superfamily (MFS) profile domain-containing protein n=1 Tax=Helobdella robusta TaxID=6412 RepID=T1FFL3_HELRO|nr:hypothetical protein HELRODRAFT_180225 [Helobdella robusta]ESN94064.1 hypothetical protein HELRODRAFT_180225 [Helobdella robusta]
MSSEGEGIIDKRSELEKIISLTGYGLFSYKLILVSGLVASSDAIEIFGVSNVVPAATCDLDLNDSMKGWINASIFIGMSLGSLVFSNLADVYGRKYMLITSLICNVLFNLAAALSTNFYPFCAFRILSGFGVGGNIPVIGAYLTEFQPLENRGKVYTAVSAFWSVGSSISGALAWIILPINFEWSFGANYVLKTWNLYLSLCSIPSLIAVCTIFHMPESPKYLLEVGKKYFLSQKTDTINELKYSKLDELKVVMKDIYKENNPSANYEDFEVNAYGMIMWFPELFKRFEMNNDSICRDQMSADQDNSCINFLLSSICVFLFWYSTSSLQMYIMSYLFGALSAAQWSVINVVIAESFPTKLRSSAFGLCLGISRLVAVLSNLVFGYLLNVYCILPFALISFFYFVGFILAFFFKETNKVEIN